MNEVNLTNKQLSYYNQLLRIQRQK